MNSIPPIITTLKTIIVVKSWKLAWKLYCSCSAINSATSTSINKILQEIIESVNHITSFADACLWSESQIDQFLVRFYWSSIISMCVELNRWASSRHHDRSQHPTLVPKSRLVMRQNFSEWKFNNGSKSKHGHLVKNDS